jgi:Domain of unknown function (DUF4124)
MQINHLKATFAALALLISAAADAQQKIYKWTDADGQVHYDSKPPTTTKAQQIRQAKAPTPVATAEPAAAAADAGTATAEAKPEMTPQQRAELKSFCSNVRDRMKALSSGVGRVAERNPDGTQTRLNKDAIDQRVAAEREKESKYCTGM